jgi:L-iditol 2-dehydrogenase
MRAGVYRGSGQIVAEDVPVPEILDGEVLLRVGACGICGTDIKKVRQGIVPPPQILGHEIAGTVVRVGAGAEEWSIGDRAISFHHIPCGDCFYCERKLFSQCPQYKKVGVTAGFQPNGGGFAQYVRIMPHIVRAGMVRIPDGVAFEEAAFVEPVNTCMKAIQKARVAPGETVFVVGQGSIGLLLAFLAHEAGAKVLTSDPLPFRRSMSLRFGAEASFDPSGIGSVGADVVLLAAPDPRLVPVALDIARPGGRVLLFAQNDPSMQIQFPAAAVGVEEKEILGSYSASVELQARSAEIVFARSPLLRELITHRFALDSIAEAFALAAQPTDDSLKLVVLP